MEIFDAIETCRAIRYFKKASVAPELIEKIIFAATRSPSPGNTQGWDFVVVTDAVKRAELGTAIAELMQPIVDHVEAQFGGPERLDDVTARMLRGALNLALGLAEVPVHIVVCGPNVYPQPNTTPEATIMATTYPAAQNILLAARALGLGSCLTTYQNTCGEAIHRILGIPDEVRVVSYIPIGYPDTNHNSFGPLARQPIENFIHANGWQGQLRGAALPE